MLRQRCDICGGRRLIRLPVLRDLAAERPHDSAVAIAPLSKSFREFPCPQCSEVVDVKRLYLMQEHNTLDSRIDDRNYVRATEKDAAHHMVAKLIEGGFITFEWGEIDTKQMRRTVRATMGVVSKAVVASMEQRVAARQDEVAREVAAEAKRKISVWGSHYSGDEGHVRKLHANEAVDEALATVLRKRQDLPTSATR